MSHDVHVENLLLISSEDLIKIQLSFFVEIQEVLCQLCPSRLILVGEAMGDPAAEFAHFTYRSQMAVECAEQSNIEASSLTVNFGSSSIVIQLIVIEQARPSLPRVIL